MCESFNILFTGWIYVLLLGHQYWSFPMRAWLYEIYLNCADMEIYHKAVNTLENNITVKADVPRINWTNNVGLRFPHLKTDIWCKVIFRWMKLNARSLECIACNNLDFIKINVANWKYKMHHGSRVEVIKFETQNTEDTVKITFNWEGRCDIFITFL